MDNFEAIPACMKELPQWVCIRSDSKCPMRAFENSAASSTDPETWSTFSAACEAVEKGYYDNIGFVFADNGLVGIDIDTGYDDDGFLSYTASDIISTAHSYTEKSRSGRGFHILVRGSLPFKGKNNKKGVEIYQAGRYFIMTGDVLLYNKIVENQGAIDYIVDAYFSEVVRDGEKQALNGRVYTPKWSKPSGGKICLRPVYPRIPNGCRNICLTSLAGMMHNQGYSKEQIYDELVYCNTVACDPCISKSEIKSIVSSVTRYKR